MKVAIIGDPKRTEKYAPDLLIVKESEKHFFKLNDPVNKIISEAGDADVLLADAIAKVPAELINKMPNLKMIHSEGVAFNGIDIDAATKNKIYVANCKGMNASAVAEQTILLMLGLLRDVVDGNNAVLLGQQMNVKNQKIMDGITDLSDCKVGLIGFGDIAKATADRLHSFGSQVYYWNHNRRSVEVEKRHHVTYLELDSLLKTCDIISLHVAVTPETEKMVDTDFLQKMKSNAYLINTARGDLIDNIALKNALEKGLIAGAGLDTISPEPVTQDNPLLNLNLPSGVKILYSPHLGGITTGSFKRGYKMMWENVARIAEEKVPDHLVNNF